MEIATTYRIANHATEKPASAIVAGFAAPVFINDPCSQDIDMRAETYATTHRFHRTPIKAAGDVAVVAKEAV